VYHHALAAAVVVADLLVVGLNAGVLSVELTL
jgi:hypothetical protein